MTIFDATRRTLEPYEKLRPFEIKEKLAQVANESSKRSDSGRVYPNGWLALPLSIRT